MKKLTERERILKMNRILNESEMLNEELGIGSLMLGMLGAFAIWNVAPVVVGLMASALGHMADNVMDKKHRAERIAKEKEYTQAAKSIAEKFKNDSHLVSLVKELDGFKEPNDKYVRPNKRQQNSEGRAKILKKINAYVKTKLTTDEMKYLKAINASVRGEL